MGVGGHPAFGCAAPARDCRSPSTRCRNRSRCRRPRPGRRVPSGTARLTPSLLAAARFRAEVGNDPPAHRPAELGRRSPPPWRVGNFRRLDGLRRTGLPGSVQVAGKATLVSTVCGRRRHRSCRRRGCLRGVGMLAGVYRGNRRGRQRAIRNAPGLRLGKRGDLQDLHFLDNGFADTDLGEARLTGRLACPGRGKVRVEFVGTDPVTTVSLRLTLGSLTRCRFRLPSCWNGRCARNRRRSE